MSEPKAYWKDAGEADEDHPEAGWYIVVPGAGEDRVFGPFSTENHATHFQLYVNTDDDHD